MSESTTSARPPIMASSFSGASSLRKSSCAKLTPGISVISRRSIAMTVALPSGRSGGGCGQRGQGKPCGEGTGGAGPRQHQIGPLAVDEIVVGAFQITHAEQRRDGCGDARFAHPDAIDPPAIVSRQV